MVFVFAAFMVEGAMPTEKPGSYKGWASQGFMVTQECREI
jgi:hypothetical protein